MYRQVVDTQAKFQKRLFLFSCPMLKGHIVSAGMLGIVALSTVFPNSAVFTSNMNEVNDEHCFHAP